MNRERIKLAVAALVTLIAVYLLAVHVAERWAGLSVPGGLALAPQQTRQVLLELREIRALLERQQGGRPVPAPEGPLRMSLEGRPSLGRRDAPVAMVEFTDYQCPFCSRFHQQTFPALKRKYMDSGRVRYVVADLPLSIHPQAERGAQAAHCAGEQGRYFPMQEALFRHTATLGPEAMVKAAGEAGLAAEAFQACLASGRHLEAIRASASLAAGLGIRGTPSFILGRIGADGELEGLRLVGAQPLEAFEQRIEALLKP